MKRTVLIASLLLAAIALAFPQPGYSWGRWYVPGAFVGGALLGAAMASTAYGYLSPAPYAYPAPAYGYPAPAYGYAYYGPRYYPGYRYHGYYGGRGHYGHRW